MVDERGGLAFAQEALVHLGMPRPLAVEHLDRDRVALGVTCPPHRAGEAAAELALEQQARDIRVLVLQGDAVGRTEASVDESTAASRANPHRCL
jgi:hypothetical protein